MTPIAAAYRRWLRAWAVLYPDFRRNRAVRDAFRYGWYAALNLEGERT